MIILGIDPGLQITGYGCIKMRGADCELIEAGVIRTKKSDVMEKRLTTLYSGLSEIVAELKPETVVIEDLYSHYQHPKTAIIMGHARGVIMLAAGKANIPVVSYGANKVKKSLTGNGHAGKEQMQQMIANVFGLPKPPSPADVADALAVGLCHANVLLREQG